MANFTKLNANQTRNYLLLHEFVSMGLMKDFDINIPKFKVASTPAEVKQITESGGSLFIYISNM